MLTSTNAMFDTERFIVEIRKRPAIYDVNCEEYNDRDAKMNAWDEVCQVMVPDWPCLSNQDKNMEEKTLRGKWRNIRDYFMKELKHQKTQKGGPPARKRKKYMYFDQLLFLMPSIENKLQRNNNQSVIIKTEESDLEVDNPVIEEYDMPESNASTSHGYSENSYNVLPSRYPKSLCETALTSFDNDLNDMLSSHSSQRVAVDEEDYDKMFLLSLLPTMRQVPEEMKLNVRIQMQQVLAAAIYPPMNQQINQ